MTNPLYSIRVQPVSTNPITTQDLGKAAATLVGAEAFNRLIEYAVTKGYGYGLQAAPLKYASGVAFAGLLAYHIMGLAMDALAQNETFAFLGNQTLKVAVQLIAGTVASTAAAYTLGATTTAAIVSLVATAAVAYAVSTLLFHFVPKLIESDLAMKERLALEAKKTEKDAKNNSEIAEKNLQQLDKWLSNIQTRLSSESIKLDKYPNKFQKYCATNLSQLCDDSDKAEEAYNKARDAHRIAKKNAKFATDLKHEDARMLTEKAADLKSARNEAKQARDALKERYHEEYAKYLKAEAQEKKNSDFDQAVDLMIERLRLEDQKEAASKAHVKAKKAALAAKNEYEEAKKKAKA